MATDTEWCDPPPKVRSRQSWSERLNQLVDRPNDWAVVGKLASNKSATSTVADLNRRVLAVPPGRWEFTSRGREVFARYLGRIVAVPDVTTPEVTDAMVAAAFDVFADAGVSIDASDPDELMRDVITAVLEAAAADPRHD